MTLYTAKKYHPDTISEEQKEKSKVKYLIINDLKIQDLFKEITEAYSVLGDTEKRVKYD